MKASLRREARQIVRFLIFGACTSLTSVVAYALLQRVLPLAVAYTLAYLLGLALSALLSGR